MHRNIFSFFNLMRNSCLIFTVYLYLWNTTAPIYNVLVNQALTSYFETGARVIQFEKISNILRKCLNKYPILLYWCLSSTLLNCFYCNEYSPITHDKFESNKAFIQSNVLETTHVLCTYLFFRKDSCSKHHSAKWRAAWQNIFVN